MEMESLPGVPRFFNAYLSGVRSDELRTMSRMWGVKSQLHKDEYIEAILEGLKDPAKVQQAIEGLEPYERMALAIVKKMGGEVETGTLVVGLYASGVSLPPRFRHVIGSEDTFLVDALIRRGLVLSTYVYGPTYISSSFGLSTVFSDERLLAQVEMPKVAALEMKPVDSPSHTTFRRPQTVMLEVLGILQAITSLGGLGLTRNGSPRVADERKLMRLLHWEEGPVQIDGVSIPDPLHAWLSALLKSGLLAVKGDRITLAEPLDQFASRPYHSQVAFLLDGFIRTQGWGEYFAENWGRYAGGHLPQGRLALSMLLEALSQDGFDFYLVKDLDKALFDRIGEHFSIGYRPSRPYSLSRDPAEIRKAETEWRAKLRLNWLQRERKWLEAALTSWLYMLGILELGYEGGILSAFRLTDLGRQVIRPSQEHQVAFEPAEFHPAWIVQPNFEIIMYLDRAAPTQLAFLEKHAERFQAQQHTAIYHLTRDSVYRGLQNGITLDELLSGLQAGSETDLPQNVVVEVREWAGLREKIALYKQASLLEFFDEQARQAAILAGVSGTLVGDRFLLLPPEQGKGMESLHALNGLETEIVDYFHPLAKCLSINEQGEINQKMGVTDLWLIPQISRWAEQQPGKTWCLTRESVQRALSEGRKPADLFALLDDRFLNSLPRMLRTAMMAWAGEEIKVELDTVTVMRCRNPEVFQTIATSKLLKPCLLGTLAPDLLLVDPKKIDILKEQLSWAGIEILGEVKAYTK